MRSVVYSTVRSLCFFAFSYVAYGNIRRVGKPKLSGPFLWSSSHSNFFCDVVIAGYEGEAPTKFLGKSTLFVPPFTGLFKYFGGLPVVRPEERDTMDEGTRSTQNRQTFKAAIEAFQQGWPVAIYPEGVSLERPGLVLPLKSGVARLAFAAESAADFSMGLKIIPVGLEYGSRARVGSGLTIRYGTPIAVKDFEARYREKPGAAVDELLERLTGEMIAVFPHFESEERATLGKKLVVVGIEPSKHSAAQKFLRFSAEEIKGVEADFESLEEISKVAGIPLPAWGIRKRWRSIPKLGRRLLIAKLVAMAPIAAVEAVNEVLPSYLLESLLSLLAIDETEVMSIRFLAAPIVLPVVFFLQYFLAMKVVKWEIPLWGFFPYFVASVLLWYFTISWKREIKMPTAGIFFKRAKGKNREAAEAAYKKLLDRLRQADHRGA